MRGRPLLPRPGLVNACVAPRTTHLRYVAVLLDDGVALCAPSLDAGMTGFIHCDAPDVIACSADGALLCVATRRELRFYAVLTGANDDGLVAPAARLRGRPQPLHSLPRPCGLDVASLVPGAAPSSAHGVAAIVGGAGLTLTQTASDDGAAPESASHHRNCPLGGCRFSDDGDLIALAAMDGRLLVRRRRAAGDNAAWAAGSSELVWCARCPCERVLTLDFAADGRWLALSGWKGDAAVYDCGLTGGRLSEEPAVASRPFLPEHRRDADAPAPAVDATSSAIAMPWENWRLVWLAAASDDTPPAPAIVRWCRAPRRTLMLCCARPVARAVGGDGTNAARLSSLSPRLWIGTVGSIGIEGEIGIDGGRADSRMNWALPPSMALLPGSSPLRGVVTGRVGGDEVLVWMDSAGETGIIPLWPWASDDEDSGGDTVATAADVHARSPYGTATLVLPSGASPTDSPCLRITSDTGRSVLALPEIAADALMLARDELASLEQRQPHHHHHHNHVLRPFARPLPVASVLVGRRHVAVLALADGAVQWADHTADCAAWRTHWLCGSCETACLVGTTALVWLERESAAGVGDVGGGQEDGGGAYMLRAMSLSATPTLVASCSPLAMFTPPSAAAPDETTVPCTAAQLLPCLDVDEPTGFGLVLQRGPRLEAWMGRVAADEDGGALQMVSERSLRVLCDAGGGAGEAVACRVIESGVAVELVDLV